MLIDKFSVMVDLSLDNTCRDAKEKQEDNQRGDSFQYGIVEYSHSNNFTQLFLVVKTILREKGTGSKGSLFPYLIRFSQ